MSILLILFFLYASVEQSPAVIVRVSAEKQWTDAEIEVTPNQQLWFAVSPDEKVQCGGATAGAEGADISIANRVLPLSTAKPCSLIGKINGEVFAIGTGPVAGSRTGKLSLGINSDRLQENSGTWRVIVRAMSAEEGRGLERKFALVSATRQWTPTGLEPRSASRAYFLVSPGNRINCDRRPTSADPGGVIPIEPELGRPIASFNACGLIGKVGNGRPFQIGNDEGPIEIKDTGPLYLGINDTTLADNSGEFRVFIVMHKAPQE